MLNKRQKEICRLVSYWKKVLLLSNYKHTVRFISPSNHRKDKILPECHAYIDIIKSKKFFRITFNNGDQIHLTMKQVEYSVIHELLHLFFAGANEVIEDTKKIIRQDIYEAFKDEADREEHKSISKLIRIVQKIRR